ncbi:uncharacterized protein N7482_003659 [Penicillium canariense]|uniref:Uncharacterized protein n=1 Tax=Penicillium canariense TaxID=189055 RepID=A0A9W9I7M0_9EURO|nr:uncharacterized protein N7482_003659 [Penicillium canariense]KAJ5168065.1 hypothetical protein N7482_003659 [Penicillium canariense]
MDDEVRNSEDEEDGDGGDWGSESEDEDIRNSEDVEPTTESAAAWLGSPPKDQDKLRKNAQSEGLRHYGLKCPGPGRVVDGLVLGTQVCPNSTIISFETGVLFRNRHRTRRIGINIRCKSCHGRFIFNEFLRTNYLEADADQKTCSHKSCLNPVWEGSKFRRDHYLQWTPDLFCEEKPAMDELRTLFDKAASEQWFPDTKIMAKVIERVETDGKANIPASEIVNIDLEFGLFSREVLQIGLANLEGARVLDCLTRYSEEIIAPSTSQLSGPATWPQKKHKDMVKAFFTQDGTLDAKGVVGKLREIGISKKTTFLPWASWCFDLSYLRDWLEAEGFHDVLPGDENVCRLLLEFRANVKRVIGNTCYQSRPFPLSLSILFLVLFGEDHPLSGRNHHALVDAQQLALMADLFIDLCKPPHKRVRWQGSNKNLGSWKRQQPLEGFFPSMSPNKKARLS